MLSEFRHGLKNRKASARGTLPVVVVGLGIAEERHPAVTQILGDVPALGSVLSFGTWRKPGFNFQSEHNLEANIARIQNDVDGLAF